MHRCKPFLLTLLCSLLLSTILALNPIAVTYRPGASASGIPLPSFSPSTDVAEEELPRAFGAELVNQVGGVVTSSAIQGDYAYLLAGQRMEIVSIKNPAEPKLVGRTGVLNNFPRSLAVSGRYAYLGEDSPEIPYYVPQGGGGLRVFDILDPAAPREIAYLGNLGITLDIELLGQYAYLANYWGGLDVVDISDPAAPVIVGDFGTKTIDAVEVASRVVDGNTKIYAYCMNIVGYAYNLVILDITRPENPFELSQVRLPYYVEDFVLRGDYAYIVGGGQLLIYSIANPSQPQELYRGTISANNIEVSGNLLFADDDYGGLKILDISSPTLPSLLGSFPIIHIIEIKAAGDWIYVSAKNDGLLILDVSKPQAPSLIGTFSESGYQDAVIISGEYAFLTGGDNQFWEGEGLWIYDLANPAVPILKGFSRTKGKILAVASGFAYLAQLPDQPGETSGVIMLNVSDPSHPVEAGFYNTPFYVKDFAIYGRIALIAGGEGGLRLVDISDPSRPTQVGALEMPQALQIAVGSIPAVPDKIYAFVNDGKTSLRIIDVTNPSKPVQVGAKDVQIRDLTLAGDRLYTAGTDNSVIAWDVTNPNQPVLIAVSLADHITHQIIVSGSSVYLAERPDGLQMLDTISLSERSWYTIPDDVYDLAVQGDYVYLATCYGGLYVVWHKQGASLQAPAGSSTLQSASDSTIYSFPAGALVETSRFWHQPRYPGNMPGDAQERGIGHFFENQAQSLTGYDQPGLPYSLTVHYTEEELQEVGETSLGLYYWNGSQWEKESTSHVDQLQTP